MAASATDCDSWIGGAIHYVDHSVAERAERFVAIAWVRKLWQLPLPVVAGGTAERACYVDHSSGSDTTPGPIISLSGNSPNKIA